MSFKWLTEDGLFTWGLEGSGSYLQEFSGIVSQISSKGTINAAISTNRQTSAAIVVRSGIDTVALRGVILPSLQINSVVYDSALVTRARPLSGEIKSIGALTHNLTVTRYINASISTRASVVTKVGSTVLIESVIRSIATIELVLSSYIPLSPENFRVQRSGSTAELTWVNGFDTYKMEIYRSNSQRSAFVKIGESFNQSYSDAGLDTTTNYSYQLIPVGITGRRGRSSYIVYTATIKKYRSLRIYLHCRAQMY